jgi:hypothetical protein
LRSRLPRLAGQEHDLERVGRHDLAQGKDERVHRPVADADLEELLEARGRLVAVAQQELVVAIVGVVALLPLVVVLVVRGREAVDAHHARDAAAATLLLDEEAGAGSLPRAARTATSAELGVSELLGPLLLAVLEEVVDDEVGVRVLGRQTGKLLLKGFVVLARAVSEEGVDLLQLEIVAIAHDVHNRQTRAVPVLVQLRSVRPRLRVEEAVLLGPGLGRIG